MYSDARVQAEAFPPFHLVRAVLRRLHPVAVRRHRAQARHRSELDEHLPAVGRSRRAVVADAAAMARHAPGAVVPQGRADAAHARAAARLGRDAARDGDVLRSLAVPASAARGFLRRRQRGHAAGLHVVFRSRLSQLESLRLRDRAVRQRADRVTRPDGLAHRPGVPGEEGRGHVPDHGGGAAARGRAVSAWM